MLIMPTTNIPFLELANKIAGDFLVKGASLEDSIVDEAKKRDLNPEEVKRLVEKSNTAASILYLKNSDNKKGSFSLAKKDAVLKRTHPTAEDEEVSHAEAVEDAMEASLPERRKTASYNEPEICVMEKQAAQREQITARDIFAAKDRLEELKQLKFAAEVRLEDMLHEVIREYQYKDSAELSKLASDACSAYGKDILALLDTAAEYMKKDISLEKYASDIVDDSTPMMQMLKQAAEALRTLPNMQRSISDLEQSIMRYLPEKNRAPVYYVNPRDNTYRRDPGILFDTLKRNTNGIDA